MGRTIGIDLGTTNTAVAAFVKGRPKVIEDDKGYKVLPSVVSRKEDGTYTVGQAAKSLILTHPDHTVYAAKRLIGRRFDSEEVQAALPRMPFHMEAGPDGLCRVRVGDELMSPVEVSAIVLTVAKQIAERALGEPVDEAVITVPAYFTHGQRSATMEAARMAGLRCDRLLNEPTAAALAYGFRKDLEKNILIFDLGGGTFDVSVLHISRGVYEVMSTSGDSYLGGEDFDLRIVDWLAERFLRSKRVDLRADRASRQRLKDAAERAKCELSFQDRASILIPRITSKDNLEETLTRAQLEELVTDLIDRTLDITRGAVQMAGLQLGEIDDVILVGGQSRMPRVREAIAGLFGKEPGRSVHPEEVVAVGAAVHAESLLGAESERPLLIDVTPFDLGIDSAGGMFSAIVERNSSIPITRTRTFTTAADNQEKVRITVRQGGSRVARENEFLAEFVLAGLRPAPRMEPKLDVTFRIDSNGMLHVSAADRATGERQQVVVRNYAEAATEPHMPTPEEAEAAEARRAAERAASGGAAAPAPVGKSATQGGKKPAAGGLSRLKGLFSRGDKGKKPPQAVQQAVVVSSSGGDPAGEQAPPEELDTGALEEVGPDEVEDLDVGALEELPEEPPRTSIKMPPPPVRDEANEEFALDDGEELEEGLDEVPEAWDDAEDELDQPTEQPAPLRFSTAMRSGAEPSVDLSSRMPNIRGLPRQPLPEPVHETFNEGELASAFLDELEGQGIAGLDDADLANLDELFAGLGDTPLEPGEGAEPPAEDPFDGADALFGELGAEDPFGAPTRAEPSQESAGGISVPRMPEGDPFAPFDNESLNAAFADDDLLGEPDALLDLPEGDPFGSIDGSQSLALDPFAEPAAAVRPAPASSAADPFQGAPAAAEDPFAGLGDPFAGLDDPFGEPPPAAPAAPSRAAASAAGPEGTADPRKPALLRVAYASGSAFGREMRRNLEQGFTFIPGTRPLAEGRSCVFELHVPGIDAPLLVDGQVTWSSRKRSVALAEAGMRVAYTPTAAQRAQLEQALARSRGA